MEVIKLRPAILVSEDGSTMATILAEVAAKRLLNVEPRLVIASKPGIGAIAKALAAGLDKNDVVVISPKDYPDQYAFGIAIVNECDRRGVNMLSQNGWLPLTPAVVLGRFPRAINQHPGPLDTEVDGHDFGGKDMYGRRVIAARLYFCREVKRDYWIEAVSHWVTPRFDRGRVIRTRNVAIVENDTVESLQTRLLPEEHANTIDVMRDFTYGIMNVPTVTRPKHWLVKPEEKEILDKCKKQAIAHYPKG
jgi:folate-dependent phosphoribosylglycinamide formyltransferase PurN